MKQGGAWSSYASGRKARVLSNAELSWRRQFTRKISQMGKLLLQQPP